MAVKNCFIRGSVVRYVQLPAEHVDTQLLEDATRRGGFRYNLRGEGNKEMSDYCPLANRSCDSSQAVTVFTLATISIRHVHHYYLCPRRSADGSVITIYVTSKQVSWSGCWITPNFDSAISTGSN